MFGVRIGVLKDWVTVLTNSFCLICYKRQEKITLKLCPVGYKHSKNKNYNECYHKKPHEKYLD